MKKLLLALAFTIAPQVQAAEYFCFEESTMEWVRLISEPGGSAFSYGKVDNEILRINLPDNVIQPEGLNRFYLNYDAPLGETFLRIYGRVSNGDGLFDIFQFGMNGDIETTVRDSKCEEF